jgi:FkbM family methyltransferase
MTVVDVGANIGEISLVCANRVGADGVVVALEPIAGIADQLRRNVQGNELTGIVQVYQQGLADQAGQLPIYASCGQTDEVEFNQGLGSLHGTAGVDPCIGVVDITTLDELAKRVGLARLDLLKIDIEGGELPCLRGGLETVRRFLPIIAVEVQENACLAAGYHSRDILALLEPLGYRFHRLEPHGRLVRIRIEDLREYQDVICVAGPTLAVESA